jgi:hypothetical protein
MYSSTQQSRQTSGRSIHSDSTHTSQSLGAACELAINEVWFSNVPTALHLDMLKRIADTGFVYSKHERDLAR